MYCHCCERTTFFKNKQYINLTLSLCVLLLCIYGIRTILRNTDWQNPEQLWKHDIQIDENYLSEEQLAILYVEEGKAQQALVPAQKAVLLFSNDVTLYNLGFVYESLDNKEKAIAYYQQALEAKNYIPWQHKHYLALYTHLTKLLLFEDKPKQAKIIVLQGLADFKENPQLLFLSSVNEYILQDPHALETVRKAKELQPGNIDITNFYEKLLKNQKIDFIF